MSVNENVTTPLEREILTHYWVSMHEFPRRTPLIEVIEEGFIKLGLLRRHPVSNKIEGVDAALRVYVDALAAVPLPVQIWSVPRC